MDRGILPGTNWGSVSSDVAAADGDRARPQARNRESAGGVARGVLLELGRARGVELARALDLREHVDVADARTVAIGDAAGETRRRRFFGSLRSH